MLDVCLLGTGGSVPKPDRWLTSAYIRYNGEAILIDCGEGTQLALKETGFIAGKIGLILLTHFHADHVSGLPGMLLAMANEGRIDPVVIAGPRGAARIVSSLSVITPGLPFEVTVIEIPAGGGELPAECFAAWQGKAPLKVTAFHGKHSMTCLGYRVSLSRAGKFDPTRAKEAGVPVKIWGRLQRGESVELDCVTYTPDMVLGEARRGLEVSYVTDTRPTPEIEAAVAGSDLLICEGMFPEDKAERARKSRHMTALEAATIAKNAGVGELWLTHFSPSMPDPVEAEAEAKSVFENAVAGVDGKHVLLKFPEE